MEVNESFLITKKFRSPTEFSLFIDEMVVKHRMSYMDAIVGYCEKVGLEIESIGPLINQKLREKIQIEAENVNLLKPTGHLPI